jgi:hypothetical protein
VKSGCPVIHDAVATMVSSDISFCLLYLLPVGAVVNYVAVAASLVTLGLGLLYLLPPQYSIISGQLPVATAQKSGSILLHHISPSFPGLSN